ncbi:hypothetical protein VTH06DRAFT_1485 [Thermothelomyces fergusii]
MKRAAEVASRARKETGEKGESNGNDADGRAGVCMCVCVPWAALPSYRATKEGGGERKREDVGSENPGGRRGCRWVKLVQCAPRGGKATRNYSQRTSQD